MSGCDPCNKTGGASYLPPAGCSPSGPSNCGSPMDSSCVKYTGANLACFDINSGSWLEDILLKMDAKFCETSGEGPDWSSFNYHCLTTPGPITTPGQFVDRMTASYCTLQTSYDTFTTSTFVTAVSNLQTQITNITNPGLVLCTGITGSDTYTSILTKTSNAICNIRNEINVSGANWNSCFSTSPLPTTVTQGFNIVLAKICEIISSSGSPVVLPTFNNQGSCLPAPLGTADSLALTINKIKTRLCQSPVYDIDSSPWGCLANPAPGTGANVQSAMNAVVNQVNTLKSNSPTFDPAYFTTTFINPGDPCSGKSISLASSITSDRFVASDASDLTPGTLIDKLQAGSNIVLDNVTTPGKVIINGPAATDQLVKSRSADPSAGFLEQKVLGKTNSAQGISVTTSTNGTTNQVDFTPSIDPATFGMFLLSSIESNPTLYAKFCSLLCGCTPCNGNTTTTVAAKSRVSFRIQNPTGDTHPMTVVVNQNSPTLGLISIPLTLGAGTSYDSGYYDLTTPFNPASLSVSVTSTDSYVVDLSVIYPNNNPVPGASTGNGPVPFTNTNFLLGATQSDFIVVIRIFA